MLLLLGEKSGGQVLLDIEAVSCDSLCMLWMTCCLSGFRKYVIKYSDREKVVQEQCILKWPALPCLKIFFDVVDGSISKAVVDSKWEEKQQWIKEDLKR